MQYDRKVAWEAYVAQFEMLASAQGWSEAEKALQLATALRGPAVEVLGHLPPAQRVCYGSVAEALRRRFEHHHQAEVYRAYLKKRTRERGETLSQLAQDVDALVRRSYPKAAEYMIVVLARDFFVDEPARPWLVLGLRRERTQTESLSKGAKDAFPRSADF